MSRKRKTYSADFKLKIVLQILEGEKTLNEIATKYELLPKNIQNWKKDFSNWSKNVDKYVDAIFEKGVMGTLEKASFPVKALADGITGDKFDIKNKNWFEVTDVQKQTNELINDYNINQTKIYESANSIKDDLAHLTKEQNRDLLKVLNGDMKLKELSDDLKPLYKSFRKTIDDNANKLVELDVLSSELQK